MKLDPDTVILMSTRMAGVMSLRQPAEQHLPVCTVSIGIACQSSSEETLDSLLWRTDTALYRAKENGRDRVEIDGV